MILVPIYKKVSLTVHTHTKGLVFIILYVIKKLIRIATFPMAVTASSLVLSELHYKSKIINLS